MVGRDAELRVLAELLGDARPESILEVAGEPGIGKSRLLREFGELAHERGHTVLRGRAAEFEGEPPFGIFRDALDDVLTELAPERLEVLAGDRAAELAVVLPVFESLAGDRPPAPPEERYRAYRAVRRLLLSLAADTPVVLVLDDVQWMDPGSAELLGHLLARAPRGDVRLAVGFRPPQLAAPLGAALAAAVREHDAVLLDLQPLGASAVTQLLGPDVPAGLHEPIHEQSGGNPFYALQLARAAAAGRGEGAVPSSVRAAVGTELGSLTGSARRLLQGAAVVGDPFEGALAGSAADVSADEELDLLDELLASGLVTPAEVQGQFAFRHPIVRSTVYESAAQGWRVRAHARVAACLLARGEGVAAQAPHLERSARKGDADAVAALVAAAEASAQHAPGQAARWYAAALHLLPEGPEAEAQRAALLLARASALSGCGWLQESRATLGELLERLPSDDPSRTAVVAFCAGVENLLGRHREANARLTAAHRSLAGGPSAEAVALELELAASAGFENRYADMTMWAQRALDGAAQLAERALEVAAAGQLALARYFVGDPADEALDRAAAGLDTLTDAELAERLDIGLWVGWSEAVLERHEQAIQHCSRVIDVARASGRGATLLVTQTAMAWSLVRVGRLEEADVSLAAAIDAGRLAPNLFLSSALGLAAVVRTQRGDHEAAIAAGEESVRLARSADAGLIPGMSGLYLAMSLIEAGQARRARDTLLEMSEGDHDLHTSRSGHAAAFEVLARAEVALGRPDAAEFWARRAQAATHGGQLAGEAAFAHRATATVALARGDAQRAAAIAQGAAVRADEAGAPGEAGRCRILAGTALARHGERESALAVLDLAAQQLERIGADGYRAQAERELRRLGRRGVPRGAVKGAGSRLAALSERECEVAKLVGEGSTNREVASALHLSTKTVEYHLSRIYAKLGLSGRTALAALVAADDGQAA